jgi:hypothetical protein
MGKWTLFSNHGHVLICLFKDPGSRLRDVAVDVGITERAVQKIVRDLQDAGMISVVKDGRRNRYRIDTTQPLRHELESHRTIADLRMFVNSGMDDGTGTDAPDNSVAPATPEPEPEPEPTPESAPEPEPEPEPAPEPEPESLPEPKPEPEPDLDREPEPEPEPEPEKPKPSKKAEDEHLIEKQQGTLF